MQVRLESLEGRVVLSTTTHLTHPIAVAHTPQVQVSQVHAATTKAQATSNPVLVNLTPMTTGITITSVTYDPRIHLITVKGMATTTTSTTNSGAYYPYTPIYPANRYIGVSASQAINRTQSVTGFEYSNLTINNPSETKVAFEGRVVASAGNFSAGIVNLTINSSDAYYNYTTLNVLARMRIAKAY